VAFVRSIRQRGFRPRWWQWAVIGLNTLFAVFTALVIGWLLLRQSATAIQALDTGGVITADVHFYEGKIAVGSFFAKNFLPLLSSTRQVIESVDNEIMALDEAAF
jgi:hypothetical protein